MRRRYIKLPPSAKSDAWRIYTLRCVTPKLGGERIAVVELVSNRRVQAGDHLKRESPKIEILTSTNDQKFLVRDAIGASEVSGCLVADDDGARLIGDVAGIERVVVMSVRDQNVIGTLDLRVNAFRVRRQNAAEFPRHVQATRLSVSTQFDHADD